MIIQTTLITGHKGVDLHAETAERVMKRRLEGGEALLSLRRAEFHTFWAPDGAEAPDSVERLLGIGRFYNPNKHHFGHFVWKSEHGTWFAESGGAGPSDLDTAWPGTVVASDLAGIDDVLAGLLCGPTADGAACVDVASFPLGEQGPLLSGVLWRLELAPGADDPLVVAESLAVARSAREGLLINPHMQGWKTILRTGTPVQE